MRDCNNVLRLEHQCPQCGAPIGMLETDRILACPFCRTRLFMRWSDGINRYYLPASAKSRVLYVPYWHFRGTEIRLSREEESHSLVDTTALALRKTPFPESVGIRAQTIKGRLLSGSFDIPFPDAEISLTEFLRSVEKTQSPQNDKEDRGSVPPDRIISDFFNGKSPRREMIFSPKRMRRKSTEDGRFIAQLTQFYESGTRKRTQYHAFIGETVSLLYFPYYVENDCLHDGLTGKRISRLNSTALSGWRGRHTHEEVRFQPAHCPHCGWDLEGDTKSIILTCRNCLSAWRSGSHGVTGVPYGYWESSIRPEVWIPFWTLRIDSEKIPLNTVGDFAMIANPYTRFPESAPESQMRFWMPAFKIHPAQLLRISSAITINQRRPRLPDHHLHQEPHFPVTLPYQEAFQAIHLLVASLCRRRKGYFELSGEENYRLVEVSLAYVPFVRRGMELIQSDINYSIQARALEHGANL